MLYAGHSSIPWAHRVISCTVRRVSILFVIILSALLNNHAALSFEKASPRPPSEILPLRPNSQSRRYATAEHSSTFCILPSVKFIYLNDLRRSSSSRFHTELCSPRSSQSRHDTFRDHGCCLIVRHVQGITSDHCRTARVSASLLKFAGPPGVPFDPRLGPSWLLLGEISTGDLSPKAEISHQHPKPAIYYSRRAFIDCSIW